MIIGCNHVFVNVLYVMFFFSRIRSDRCGLHKKKTNNRRRLFFGGGGCLWRKRVSSRATWATLGFLTRFAMWGLRLIGGSRIPTGHIIIHVTAQGTIQLSRAESVMYVRLALVRRMGCLSLVFGSGLSYARGLGMQMIIKNGH